MAVNSRAKGVTAEQQLAAYLRAFGEPWSDARRSVSAGWRNGDARQPDRGDLTGVPGLCVQAKNLKRPLVGKLLADTWHEVRDQAVAAGGLIPIIVEKRTGSADPGRWWLWMSAADYVEVIVGRRQFVAAPHLVRVELGDVVSDLRIYSRTIARHCT